MNNADAPASVAKKSTKDFLTVGIGASAGGIKALKEFFSAMPGDSGMAFVVILHLSQEHESHLSGILQTNTAMTVTQVTETLKLEPNNVYVIPPSKHLKLVDGVVKLVEPERTRGRRVPIDLLFRTLGEAHGKNAVCIVLSGTGSDGTLGLKRVKESGGIAIVQDPAEAEYDGMPRSAIETNLADVILPIAEMPAKLLALKASAAKLQVPDDDDKPPRADLGADALREVLTLLRIRTGHDFSNYKRPTLLRRVARRLQVHELADIPAYLDFLRENPDEIQSLLRDLLISVTNFFRDHEAFAELEREIVPRLFHGKTAGDQIRVWVAGCATGEEAYSIAMLLCEYAEKLDEPPKIQIFASDIDEQSIGTARDCRYDEAIVADVSPDRLKKFFVKEGTHYRVKKSLRETVLFAPHNLLRDPPFSKLDLISCRNLLIYLNRQTQARVFEIFHFALRREGFLFLGSSESAEGASALFSTVDKKHRIYKSRVGVSAHRHAPVMPIIDKWQVKIHDAPTANHDGNFSFGELHHKLVEKYAPPSVLVNEDYDILHLSESVGRFLRFTGGEPSRNLLKAVHPNLRLDLRAALIEAKQEKRAAESRHVAVNLEGKNVTVNLIVRPFETSETADGFLLVIFEEQDGNPTVRKGGENAPALQSDGAAESIVRRLEDDLQHTKNRLRATIEQNETSVEELRASNEELQAINEELRSASEELETSKEELQSVNEELVTVNHELKDKIDEVSHANSDLQNLMSSTDIGTIFLDRELQIKRYTPSAQKFFNIIQSDVGRPLEHITHKLEYDKLAKDAAEVLRSLKPFEREICDTNGDCYIARFLPYRTLDDKIDGVVLTFIDINERKLTEETQQWLAAIVSSSNDAIISFKPDRKIVSWNAGAERVFGYTEKEVLGQPVSMFVAPERAHEQAEIFTAIERGESIANYETVSVRKNGEMIDVSLTVSPFKIDDGKILGVTAIVQDVTAHKRAEEEVRRKEERFRVLFELGPVAVFACDRDGIIQDYNSHAAELWGRKPKRGDADERYCGSHKLYYPDGRLLPHAESPIVEVLRAGVSLQGVEVFIERLDGSRIPVIVNFAPLKDEQGEIVGAITSFVDITERKQMEEALRESEEKFRHLANSMSQFAWMMDADGWIFWYNERWFEYTGTTLEEMLGWGWQTVHHPNEIERVVEKFKRHIASGEAWEDTFPLRSRTGEYRWFLSRALPIQDAEGKIVRWFGTNTDIEDVRRAEEALKDADKRKDEFLAMLAHELRNPLAPIRSGLEIIRRADGDETMIKQTLETVERQTNQIVHLVDDLLDISRITQGKIKLKKERIELRTAVEMALETNRELIALNGHDLTVSLPDAPVFLDADLTRIAQIILNLLNNSAKYTEPDGKIWLTAETKAHEVEIRIRDNGIGIPPEMLSNIFEMFTQIETSGEQTRAGLGIGLSVVKSLVEMHDGTITAFSAGKGKGSEFVVRLPRLRDEGGGMRDEEEIMKDEINSSDSSLIPHPSSLKILVVDDNADALEMMRILLTLDNHTVRTALDGETAIKIAPEFQPQVCILDIGLPIMNGYELARRLRMQMPQVLLIALSGWGQDEDRRRSTEAGFNHHLVKPIEIEELENLLAEIR